MGPKNILIALFILYLYFFKLTQVVKPIWPKQIENKLTFQVIITSLIYILSTPVYFLIFLPGYLGAKIYQPYRVQKDALWPWEKPNWKQVKPKTIKNLLINNFIVFPSYILIGLSISGTSLDFEAFPTPFEIIKAFGVILIIDDMFFMIIHLMFHKIPFLYQRHKIHHQYNSVFSVMGQFAHPLEFAMGNLFPGTMTFFFYKAHIYTFSVWLAYKLYNSNQGHSGFQFPWSPARVFPLFYGASYHDFHHSANIGNYATRFYLTEMICGTNKQFFDRQIEKMKVEERQQQLQKAK